MTCKDCYHYEACKFNNKNLPEEYDPIEWQCDNFKNKSRIIELPCKVTNGFKEKLTKYCHERCFDEL